MGLGPIIYAVGLGRTKQRHRLGPPKRSIFLIVSKDKNFVFYHNPKTAGISLRKALLDGVEDATEDWSRRHETPPKDNKGYEKVTVIRNPWDRAYSMFCWRQQRAIRRIKEGHKNSQFFKKELTIMDQGFNSWILRGGTGSPFNQDIYGKYCTRILLFENLQEEFNAWAKELRINATLEKLNISKRNKGYQEEYSEGAKNYIRKVSSWEIEKWGYEF